jgi:hypothetical protein
VGSDQRLEHLGKAFDRAARAEGLRSDASAFAQQEQLVGEQFGIAQSSFAAEFGDPLPEPAFRFLDDPPGGMAGIRQFDRRVGEGAAALVGADFKLGSAAQRSQASSCCFGSPACSRSICDQARSKSRVSSRRHSATSSSFDSK